MSDEMNEGMSAINKQLGPVNKGASAKKRHHHRKRKGTERFMPGGQRAYGMVLSYVEHMNPYDLIMQDTELLSELRGDLCSFLENQRVTYFHAEEDVSEKTYDKFLSMLSERGLQIMLSRAMRGALYQRIEKKIINSSEDVKAFLDSCESPKQGKRVRTLIKSRVFNMVMDPLVRQLCSDMSIEEVRLHIGRNPRYMEAEKARQERDAREEALTANILREIPDHYPDLYPAARRMKRHFIIHIGPTNSGKTYDAIQALERAEEGIYLGPLRLLAHEVYERLTADGVPCRMKTGEEDLCPEVKKHQASTIEMMDAARHYNVAVIDEIQMIADRQRGRMWTAAILGVCADEVHLCGAREALDIVTDLIEDCGDSYELVQHERATKLIVESDRFVFPDNVQDKDALIVFSKRNVLACAAELQSRGISCSIIYGALPYDVRKEEVRKFAEGENKVVVATDAIGMGMNLPIRRVVFLESEKFDGVVKRVLSTQEILQIGGRAGRRGLFDTGYVNAEFRKGLIKKAFVSEVEPIERVALPFPESLLGLEGKLSDIFAKWGAIQEENDEFDKADLSVEIKLCKFLEQKTDDKELIYKFITVPFDEDNVILFGIWEEMVDCEIEGEVFDYRRAMPEVSMKENSYGPGDLSLLEDYYQICDLICYYLTRFGEPEDYDEVSELRSVVAVRIMEVLSRQELQGRKCRRCGKPIKWNYPYNICENCYASSRTIWY
ncbi:helicase-related protein [Butyrivibrio sp. MC2013]|uniref:helicase-related protein n=1 Tax=Butyrivibrio sp. MC2013 TaxID=1280686 RepID=UPI00041E62D8|nr:DEAD/DEAH box helicase [Butyrivibrio sp. MC2013]